MTLNKTLTIEQKVGQLCLLGYNKSELNNNMINIIDTFHIGGIILTTEQFEHPKQIYHLTDYLQKYAGIDLPLYIGVHDKIQPLAAKGMTQPISHEGMELKNNRLYTKQHAEMSGLELHAVGLNAIIAPNVQLQNEEIHAFMDQFRSKMQHAIAAIEGYEKASINTFPKIDTVIHKIVQFDATDKGRVQLYFEKFLSKAKSIYVEEFTTSSILRNTFQYDGLIIADLSSDDTTVEDMVHAINAGADAIILSDYYEVQLSLLNKFVEAVKVGALSLTTIETALDRILHLKQLNNFGQVNPYDREQFMQRRYTRFVERIITTT